jgi:4-hydroxythreonine-4-phosphate dehydrogenase
VKIPPLAVSLGDPAGIGPEITVKAWRALRQSGPAFIVVGDREVLAAAAVGGQVALKRIGFR